MEDGTEHLQNARLGDETQEDKSDMPTSREIDLARRVGELERENQTLQNRAHNSNPGITIPESLIPLLSQLRTHIASLTADNKALNLLLRTDVKQPEWPQHNINLQLVLERVKKLTRENDEMAEMVLQAGRVGGEELEDVLEEYKSTVLGLEKELEDEQATHNATKSELVAYKARFGPLNAQPPPQNRNLQRSQSNRNSDPGRGRRKPKP